MRRSYSKIYCINLIFVIICANLLFIYDTVSNGLVSKQNIVSEEKSQNNYEAKGRILSSNGGVQGIWNSRNDLLRFRRRSTYTHLDRLHDCFFRGFLDTLIWLTEETYKNENSNENSDDVTSNHDDVTSNHDDVTANHDDVTANHDDVTSNHDDVTANHDGVTVNHDGITSNHDGVTSNHNVVTTIGEQFNTNVEMIEKIIRKQMYLEGITLSNRTVSNEVRRTKERHDEILAQGTTAEVMERMMKLYEIENTLSKDIMKKVSNPEKRNNISNVLNVEYVKTKLNQKLLGIQNTYDESYTNALASRIVERVSDICRDEDIL
ncbi:gametocyte associated protein [Plasmodium reichenowi]|uniref:Gametocyte associated protein n=1 Tax=Plasmodium reichenowi TaxID=5854 RepID=A0A151L273_PLARE|nr:gametocyte associated protein [Plasmodium reichenowi]KYN93048.1 gametocyte associated protein [Plasmodium reichenowi]